MALARTVANPVLELSARRLVGRVLGGTSGTTYVDFGGTVVAATSPEAPRMPTGVELRGPLPPMPRRIGSELRPGVLRIGRTSIAWDPASPPAWDPRIAVSDALDPGRVSARGAGIMARLEPDASRPRALTELFRSVAEGDPERARPAARALIGLGPGLTPEGDDYVAGAAVAIHVIRPPWAAGWLDEIVPSDLASRTTALSATLLRLAAAGATMEPVHPLLEFGVQDRWRAGLTSLLGIGHSTGRAYAYSIGVVMCLLGGVVDGLLDGDLLAVSRQRFMAPRKLSAVASDDQRRDEHSKNRDCERTGHAR